MGTTLRRRAAACVFAAALASASCAPIITFPPDRMNEPAGGAAHLTNPGKIIAVSRFESKIAQPGLDTGMADQLTDALVKSGDFIVLERLTFEDVDKEQQIAASKRAAASKSAQIGKLLSAQILIKGTVTEFECKSGGGGLKVDGVGLDHEEATVGLNIRLIDTTTGQVLDSLDVQGKATADDLGIAPKIGEVQIRAGAFSKTPLAEATQDAINQTVKIIAEKFKHMPFQARVIDGDAKTVTVNAGSRNGVVVRQLFTVYRPGKPEIDPDTGEQLGARLTRIGDIIITDVAEKFAIAKPYGSFNPDGSLQLKTDDLVELPPAAKPDLKPVTQFQFIPDGQPPPPDAAQKPPDAPPKPPEAPAKPQAAPTTQPHK